MKKIIFLSAFLFSLLTIAQENYETVVIPKKFDIFKNENQYNINALCKSFFETEGFKVFYEGDLSEEEYFKNRCNFLYVDLEDNGNILNTKVTVFLKDCKKEVILQSQEFKTKEKEYHKAYNEVVRAALVDLRGRLVIENKNPTYTTETKTENTIFEKKIKPTISTGKVLIPEITTNGYNLLDENKNIIFELLKTSNPSVFTAKKGNIQGILTLNGSKAKFESYQNDVLVVEEVEVKF